MRIVAGGRGESGPNAEYVLNTVRHLDEAGVHDPILGAIAKALHSQSNEAN